MITIRCQLGHLCVALALATAKIQLQSKLSDNVSYLSHYGTKFMAATNKICFSDDDELVMAFCCV